MKLLCIIPARAGSKRLPGKNMIMLHDKPLLWYTLNAATSAKVFDEIIVSSEDQKILEYANGFEGIEAMKRPVELADDISGVLDVSNHVLDTKGDNYDYVVILLPSTPYRDKSDIQNAISILDKNEPDGVVAVTNYSFPLIYAVEEDKNGFLYRSFPEKAKLKSQQSADYFVGNGGIHALKPEFIRQQNYFPPKTLAYKMPFWRSIDIDTREDLEIAEALYAYSFEN